MFLRAFIAKGKNFTIDCKHGLVKLGLFCNTNISFGYLRTVVEPSSMPDDEFATTKSRRRESLYILVFKGL